jgi:arsenite methyltransferase
MMGLENNDLSIFENKIILDVGVGSGSSARIWAASAKEFHGIDISNAIYRVNSALKNLNVKPILAKADLNKLPYPDCSFDIIVSNGVLHHTPNTKLALRNVIKKLKKSGKILFYIYKKKSPIREYSDDLIREKISNLSNDDAWKSMEPITKFAKLLHEKSITINVPDDIDVLGIPKGEYDLQRFFYQYFFKCYWNDKWGFDDSNMVNFDWYSPKYAWRQTEDDIRNWCNEFKLEIEFLKEKESGYACLARKSN